MARHAEAAQADDTQSADDDTTPQASDVLHRKFMDFEVTVPVKFHEGDILTADQARWASSQLATVIGNSFGGIVRKLAEGETIDAQAVITDMYNSYDFTSKRGGGGVGTPSDPVGRMVNFLASEELKRMIVSKGFKVRDWQTAKGADGETSKFAETLAKLIERRGEEFRAQAEATLANTAQDDDLLDEAA